MFQALDSRPRGLPTTSVKQVPLFSLCSLSPHSSWVPTGAVRLAPKHRALGRGPLLCLFTSASSEPPQQGHIIGAGLQLVGQNNTAPPLRSRCRARVLVSRPSPLQRPLRPPRPGGAGPGLRMGGLTIELRSLVAELNVALEGHAELAPHSIPPALPGPQQLLLVPGGGHDFLEV